MFWPLYLNTLLLFSCFDSLLLLLSADQSVEIVTHFCTSIEEVEKKFLFDVTLCDTFVTWMWKKLLFRRRIQSLPRLCLTVSCLCIGLRPNSRGQGGGVLLHNDSVHRKIEGSDRPELEPGWKIRSAQWGCCQSGKQSHKSETGILFRF
jgi:hypothetical protein